MELVANNLLQALNKAPGELNLVVAARAEHAVRRSPLHHPSPLRTGRTEGSTLAKLRGSRGSGT